MYMLQYEGDLSELETKLSSSKERVNKINQEMRPIEVGVVSKIFSFNSVILSIFMYNTPPQFLSC